MFKRAILSVCALIFVSAPVFAQAKVSAVVIDGQWQWIGSAGWQQIVFDFKVAGNGVEGTIRMGPGPAATGPDEYWKYFFKPAVFQISNGRVDGDTITFEQSIIRGAGMMTDEKLKYTGKINEGRITFTRESFQRIQKSTDPFVLGDHQFEFTAERIGPAPPKPQRSPVDAAEKPVTNLIQENSSAGNAQWNVLLLFDHNLTWLEDSPGKNSPNYLTNQWNLLLQAATRFLGRLRPADRVAIAGFEDSVQIGLEWQNAHDGQNHVVLRTTEPPGGQKDFYGAMGWAAKKFGNVSGRKIAVVFTDGRDGRLAPRWLRNGRPVPSASGGPAREVGLASYSYAQEVLDPLFGLPDAGEERDFARVLQNVAQSGVQFYFVAINTSRDPEFGPAIVGRRISGLFPGADEGIEAYLSRVRSRMERLAMASGGRVFYGDTPEDAISIYAGLQEKLGLGK